MAQKKHNILLIGAGGVGTIAALNLERGSRADVTVVLRSNYQKVADDGFTIDSVDHGSLSGWRPSRCEWIAFYARIASDTVIK